jgi:hypothetical protein
MTPMTLHNTTTNYPIHTPSSQNNFLIYTLCINFAIAFHVTKIIPWLHACIIYGIPYQFRDFIPCHANNSATTTPPSRILHGPSVLASVLLRRRRRRHYDHCASTPCRLRCDLSPQSQPPNHDIARPTCHQQFTITATP